MIQAKPKECSNCKKITVLWTSNPKLCKICSTYLKSQGNISSPKQRSTIIGKVSSGKIKSVSDKMLVSLREYRLVRDLYMDEYTICEHPECSSPSTELHHKKGRIGNLLTDSRYFCALCHDHHEWSEKNPILAKELGLSMDRLTKD
jgi:hypothetical protein